MWMKNSRRRIFFDMHFPDWSDKKIADQFDLEHIAQTFYESHVDSVIVYAKCQYGNFYYDSKVGHKHRGLGSQDLFNGLKHELKERGIKTIAYYSVSWDEYMAERHPEWIVLKSDGTQDTDEFRWKTLCVNSAYREVVKEHILDILHQAKPDGFWIDMTIIGKDRCYCKACREKFKALHGYDIPVEADENYDEFVQFRYDYIEEFYKEIYQLIKAYDPEIQVTNNYWGYPYSSSSMGSRAIGALQSTDYVTGEAYTDWTGLNAPSFFTKFLRGVSEGKPYEALIGRFYNTWDYTVKPYEQLAFEAYSTVANGACVTVDDEPYHNGSIDDSLYQDLGEIFYEIKKREKYLGGHHVKGIGIFHSQLSKDYFYHGDERFIRNIAGSFKLFRDLHMPIDFIFDENVLEEDLSGYPVIVLPSVAVISESILIKLMDYAKRGGLLIFSGISGIYQIDRGKISSAPHLLKKWFDVESEGVGDFSLSYMYGDKFQRPSLIKGQYMKYSPKNEAKWKIAEPICETSKDRFFHNNLPSPYTYTNQPAVIERVIEKGKAIFIAQPIFTHYAKQSQLELRSFVKEIIDLNVESFPVSLYGPNRLDIDVWEKDNALIIHLLNPNPAMSVCCGYMDTFEGAYPRTFEYMDEVIPVYDVQLSIRGHYKESQIQLVDGGIQFELQQKEGSTRITVKKLDIWETIVIKKDSV